MQTNCNAYTADVVVLHFIGDNITLYLKYRNQIRSILWEIALCIYDGEDDFSLSRLSGEKYIATYP